MIAGLLVYLPVAYLLIHGLESNQLKVTLKTAVCES